MCVPSHQEANFYFAKDILMHKVMKKSKYNLVFILCTIVELQIKDWGQWSDFLQLEQHLTKTFVDQVGSSADKRIREEEVSEAPAAPMNFAPYDSLPIGRKPLCPSGQLPGPVRHICLFLVHAIYYDRQVFFWLQTSFPPMLIVFTPFNRLEFEMGFAGVT